MLTAAQVSAEQPVKTLRIKHRQISIGLGYQIHHRHCLLPKLACMLSNEPHCTAVT